MPALDTDDSTTSIGQLVQDLQRRDCAPLSREEERRLLEEYDRTGDPEIRNQIVAANVGIALKLAAEHPGHLEYEDACSVALSGLIRGVDHYNPSHPARVKASSYAVHWVHRALQDAEAHTTGTVRRTNVAACKCRKLQRERRALRQELGHPPSDDEIREALNVSARELRAIRRTASSHRVTRLDDTVGHDDGASVRHEIFPGADADSVAENTETEAEREYLERILSEVLTEREALILRLRFGLENGDTQTLREIGNRLDLSRERIRQLEERALDKLRRSGDADELREAWERGYLKAA